jgi:hypothetical protein
VAGHDHRADLRSRRRRWDLTPLADDGMPDPRAMHERTCALFPLDNEARDTRPPPRNRPSIHSAASNLDVSGHLLMRGLANVRAEFSAALAYNLRRALNTLGVEAMTAAVAA